MITGFNTDVEFEGTTYHVQTEDKGLARPVIMSLIYDRGTILASKRTPYDDLVKSGSVDDLVLAERLNKQHRVICAAVKGGRLEDLTRMSQASTASKGVAEPAVAGASVTVPSATPRAFELDVSPIPMPIPAGDPAAVTKPIDLDLNAYAIIEEEILLPDEAVEVLSEMIGKERPVNNKLSIELLGDSRFRGGEHKSVTFMVCRGSQSKVIADAQVMIKVLGSSFRPMIFHARTDANGIAKVNLQFPTFSEGRAALLVRASSEGEEVEFRRVVAHG
ncbi:MAG: hypothetical protein ABIR33_01475 [Pyrinomonadaceae bacterium]